MPQYGDDMAIARSAAEDIPMLRGTARYTADLVVPDDCLHAAFVRSTVAHGDLRCVALRAVEQSPGVVAAFAADGLGLEPFEYYPATTLGGKMARPLLAQGKVRFVGEPVAVVLADSSAQALDSVELAVVEIDELPAIVDAEQAADSSVLLFDEAQTNVVRPLDPLERGGFQSTPSALEDPAAPPSSPGEDPCAGAHCVVELMCDNHRITSLPLEPCAIVATPSGIATTTGAATPTGTVRLTGTTASASPESDVSDDIQMDIWSTGQGVHGAPAHYARLLGLPDSAVRVREPHVGGGFGGRADPMPEFFAIARAAQLVRRPVRWVQSRQEQFVSMPYGRGQRHRIRMGFDAHGRIVGIDVVMWCDAGAYPHMAPALTAASYRQSTGMYRVPRLRYRRGAAVTNAPPTGAYRGAGQPEVNAALERAIDAGARELGLDAVEIRRRNLLQSDELPFDTGTGITLDSGDPHRALDYARELIDAARWEKLAAQRRSAAGLSGTGLIGIGYGCYSQTAGSGDDPDYASLELGPNGSVLVTCGSHGHGQGHHSLWAQIISARVGINADDVRVNDADSAASPFGSVTGGSRTASVLGSQVAAAATELKRRICEIAAELLEAASDDIQVTTDGAHVAGVPSRLASWSDIAVAAPDGISATVTERRSGPTHPYGTHAAVVEVDVETGGVKLLAFAAVDDCGRTLHEASVEGQQHGGAVAGISQALMEAAQWDADGTPRTVTLADYLIPTAAELPHIETGRLNIPTNRNGLGTRGIGENGAIAAPPAVQNAVVDAVAHLGVTHIDMPLAPQRVWEAINAAQAALS